MRNAVLALALLSLTLAGTGCLEILNFLTPGAQNPPTNDPVPATSLGIVVEAPTSDASVPADSQVSIRWSAANRTGRTARVTILVEELATGTESTIADGLAVNAASGTITSVWSTDGFPAGIYRVRARITLETTVREDTAPGRITIDDAPTFAFTRPANDITLPESDPVEISWTGFDPEGDGTVRLFVDPDSEDTTANRILISEEMLGDSADDEEQSFDWSGLDSAGTRVPTDTYNVVAVVDDGVNPEQVFVAPGQISVPDASDGNSAELAFTMPEEDTTFLTSDDPLEIALNINQASDALVDIAIDTDDNHANGNETTILSQRFIEADTDTTEFEWDGTDSDGAAVADNIYRLFFVSSTGSGAPIVMESEFLVFRRSSEAQALIALTAPGSVLTLNPGQFLTINWRDDLFDADPDDENDPEATIRIVLDDDNMPNEGVETDNAEMQILADREAFPDGVQDTFQYRIPNSLTPGTYYLFAYIDSTDDPNTPDHISIGPAAVVIEDPSMPNNP
ncbi:MAG: hypothetical protein AB7N71_07570 [Phycisphaerae bacterium]